MMGDKHQVQEEGDQSEVGLENVTISVAPMLDVTNTHFRMFCRMISQRTELWTEMVVDDTIIHCYDDDSRRRVLEEVHFQKSEKEDPLVLQLGGSSPEKLERAIEIAYRYGFRSFNLNVGCPSCKVASKGSFGASLFKDPLRVARIVDKCNKKLRELGLVDTRISVKTRVGVDQFDTYQHLYNFVSLVSGKNVTEENVRDFASIFSKAGGETGELDDSAVDYSRGSFLGADKFIIHARKAWLNGINPSKNRTIPKLKYNWVYLLTLDFPDLTFILNGGVTSIEESVSILKGEWFLEWYLGHHKGEEEEGDLDLDLDLETEREKNKKIKPNNYLVADRHERNLAQAYEELYLAISSKRWRNKIKGVMIGREVMNNPFILSKVDPLIYGTQDAAGSHYNATRRDVLGKYCEYLSTIKPRKAGSCKFTIGELNMYLKPVFGIFHGFPGTKRWKRTLSELVQKHKKEDPDCSHEAGPREILLESISLFEKDHSDILDSF